MKNFFKIVAATLVALILFFGISATLSMCTLVSLASLSQTETILTDNAILRIKLNGKLVERSESDELEALRALAGDKVSTVALSDIREALSLARQNTGKIKALYLDCEMLSAAPASIEELRQMIAKFREETGMPVFAYADNYSQGAYWLASVADSVFLNPHGMVGLTGISMNNMFFSKALDKLGVEMQIFKVGTFKSAVEPYILDKMSDANRLQMQTVTDGLWSVMAADIADGRNVEIEALNRYIDNGGFLQPAEYAVELGLVDGLKYRADVNAMFDTLYTEDSHFVSVSAMRGVKDNTSYKANKVAVLYAVGGIDDGSSDGIESNKIVSELNRLAKNDKVKAVVLRVNSPGGSAFGSEQMWDAARRLKEKKPFIVSMSDYAASGGYYMSCIADTIVAQKSTLTGSIGIFGMVPNFEGISDKLGVSIDGVKSHDLADFGNTFRPMRDSEKALLQRNIERGYELFVSRCADGRHETADDIKSIAEGRVWLGIDAIGLNLVDVQGGLDEAIAIAAEKANLTDNYSVAEYPVKKDLYTSLLEMLNDDIETRAIRARLGINAYLFDHYQRVTGATGIQALMPYRVDL